MTDTFCLSASTALTLPARNAGLTWPAAAQHLLAQTHLPDARQRENSMEDSMFTEYDRTFASPSLEATMNHGLFGCANLTPASESVRMQRNSTRGARVPEKTAPARAKGFSAYLSGRLQRI